MTENELFRTINQCVEDLDFISARKYMEENVEFIKQHSNHLNRNARGLFDFVVNESENMLDRREMQMIYSINQYATSFDVRGLKLLIKDQAALLSKKEAVALMNEDAKALLEGMRAITLPAK